MKKNKYKVWLVNQYAVPTSLPGITRHFELVNEVEKRKDIDVTIWLSDFNYSLRRFLSKSEKATIAERHSNVKLKWIWAYPHKINNWKRMINMFSFSILFFVKALFSEKPDVILGSSPQMFSTYFAMLVAKLFNVKFVLEIRDLWPQSLVAMNGIKPGKLLDLLYWMESQLYLNSHKIIVLTEHQRTYLIEKSYEKADIVLIPNGVQVSKLKKPTISVANDYRAKMNLPENAFVLMYTGAHGSANALENVILAGKYLESDEFIVLIGDGPEKDKLVELQRTLSIHQVVFIDPVPKTEILNYTAAADCGLISLEDNEVFRGARPNKLFDYMFLGKPIISTIGGEVEFILESNKVGICAKSNDPTDLAEKIKQMRHLSDEEKHAIEVNGSMYILKEGNREESAIRFWDILMVKR